MWYSSILEKEEKRNEYLRSAKYQDFATEEIHYNQVFLNIT